MSNFTIYPAIDLRGGQVVRLKQGDPNQQTIYGNQPPEVARRWIDAGARWIHVVNLDGAFGEDDTPNKDALAGILGVAVPQGVRIQFGGGIRSSGDVKMALALGVSRVILGTVAAENPGLVAQAVAQFGAEAIGVGIDARDGQVRVRGWREAAALSAVELGKHIAEAGGVRHVVFTNIARDGVGTGVDVDATQALAEATGLSVIASGGVATLDDVKRVREAGLSGVIIGRALYERQIDLREALTC